MNKIKYVGPFHQVGSEGVQFVRHVPVSVSASLAAKLLKSKQMDGKSLFVEVDSTNQEVSVVDESPVLETATA